MGIRISSLALLVACTVSLTSAFPAPVAAKDGENARAAIAALMGVGIGIAASKHGKTHNSNTTWDADIYGQPFQLAGGVLCVPRIRQCFQGGRVSYYWTR